MEIIQLLPPESMLQTPNVLLKLIEARSQLAELKGIAASIPNQNLLIDTLALQEAKESSAIENIVTTHDELYRSNPAIGLFSSSAAKEVYNYAHGLRKGFELIKKHDLLTCNHIIEVQAAIDNNLAGYRKLPGTKLMNDQTGEVVYTPPQDYDTISRLMDNLEKFINDDSMLNADPLVKMAIIHHQFESIHPFYDGNGRTGRIINLLYLILKGLLDLPVLYISRFIIKHKTEYYRLLQQVRTTNEWEEWILFMLAAVTETSRQGIVTINGIRQLMLQYKHQMRTALPKIYSQDLLNNIFRHPYTKIEILMSELGVGRLTAAKYLEAIVRLRLLTKVKVGRDNYFINQELVDLLMNLPEKNK
ncbi:MAG: Fic/DOC family N-terminal domain-containing protein [Chitinophagales bacterium]|nr:Fic/DOC family N-terminal domain-containing protein [Chitinophagales bacterium]